MSSLPQMRHNPGGSFLFQVSVAYPKVDHIDVLQFANCLSNKIGYDLYQLLHAVNSNWLLGFLVVAIARGLECST